MEKKLNSEESEKSIWITASVFILIIIGLWVFTYYDLKDLKNEDKGTFGDMFGSVNAIYSGMAFAGIIFTILLQRKELKYQREELSETRKEFITQNKTLKSQRFENTFFNLISIHNQIVNDIDYDKPIGEAIITVNGRDVFRDRYFLLKKRLDTNGDYNKIYQNFYEERKTDFGHYFRNLYRIIKMVNETEFISRVEVKELKTSNKLNEEHQYKIYNYLERYKYTSIVRAQLSDYELLLLFYNCLTKNGIEKFKPLIEEYSLFKNLPQSDIQNKDLVKKYKSTAFERKYTDQNCA